MSGTGFERASPSRSWISRTPGDASGGTAQEAVGLAMWPLASAISVYGKLGVFRGKAKSNAGNQETNYGPLLGVGAERCTELRAARFNHGLEWLAS